MRWGAETEDVGDDVLSLLGRKDVIVTNVRYYLQEMDQPPPKDALAEEVHPALPAVEASGTVSHGH